MDLKTSDMRFQSTAKLSPAISASYPDEGSVFGIALVYDFSLELSVRKPIIVVDRKIERMLKDTLIDMIVVGKSSSPSGCAFFKKFYPSKRSDGIGRKTFHFIPQIYVGEQLISYSYCGIARETFQPISYRPSVFTPGFDNDCQTNALQIEERNLKQRFDSILLVPVVARPPVPVVARPPVPVVARPPVPGVHRPPVPVVHRPPVPVVHRPPVPVVAKRRLEQDAIVAGSSDPGVQVPEDSYSKKMRWEIARGRLAVPSNRDAAESEVGEEEVDSEDEGGDGFQIVVFDESLAESLIEEVSSDEPIVNQDKCILPDDGLPWGSKEHNGNSFFKEMVEVKTLLNQCPASSDMHSNSENLMEIQRVSTILSSSFGVSSDTVDQVRVPWAPYLKQKDIDQMQTHQSDSMPVAFLKNRNDIKSWAWYRFNKDNPQLSTVGCWKCYYLYDSYRLSKQYKSELAKDHGVLPKSKEQVSRLLDDHSRSPSHLYVEDKFLQQVASSSTETFITLQKMQDDANDSANQITNRMMRTVYSEVLINVPFSSHSTLVELQEANGLDFGNYFRSDRGAKDMTLHISKVMDDTYLDELMSSESPLTLIIDEATDRSMNPYLVVLFMTLQDNMPVLYLDRLVKLTSDVTSQGIFNSMISSWEGVGREGFVQHLKRHIRAMSSDGASVMRGSRNSVFVHLNQWCDNDIYSMHCMPHRLHLGGRRAMKEIDYLMHLESVVNKLHATYKKSSHKKRSRLIEMALSEQEVFYQPRHVFDVRWITSEYDALYSLYRNWKLYVLDLKEMSQDMDLTEEQRRAALDMANELLSRKFVVANMFLLDATKKLSVESQTMQRDTSFVFEKYGERDSLLTSIELLKSEPGKFLNTLQEQVICTIGNMDMHKIFKNKKTSFCSLLGIYESEIVIWRGIQLAPSDYDSDAPRIFEVREKFVNKLIEELGSYFPEAEFKYFQIFNPKLFPTGESQLENYGKMEIGKIAVQFGYDEFMLVDQWLTLMGSFATFKDFCKDRTSGSKAFWHKYLSLPQESFTIPPELRKLIEIILILPTTSSPAERSFSLLELVKTKRRNRMSHTVLESIMRIKMNSKWKNPIEFPANFFTEKWLDLHMRCDDPSCSVRARGVQAEVYRADEYEKDMNDNDNRGLVSRKGH